MNLWASLSRKRHDPIEAKLAQLDQARGAVVGTWASIESCLDKANQYGWTHTDRTISNVVPQNMRWKRQLFEKLHVKVPLFEPLKANAATLLARIDRQNEQRDFIVHGYHSPDEGEGWLLKKHVFQKDGNLGTIERRFLPDDFALLLAELTDIQKQAVGYIYALLAEISKDQAHQMGS